jgi:hypothetical protein
MSIEIKPWKCLGCEFILGYAEGPNILRIKRKDLYIEINGGKDTVIEMCPRCGKPNKVGGEIKSLEDITS